MKKSTALPSGMKLFSLAMEYICVSWRHLYFNFSHSSNYSLLLLFLLSFAPAHFALKKSVSTLCIRGSKETCTEDKDNNMGNFL